MTDGEPQKTSKQLAEEFSEMLFPKEKAAEHKARLAAHQAARKAEWDAKTEEEKAAQIRKWNLESRLARERGDSFKGMDDDDAEFLRDWLGT